MNPAEEKHTTDQVAQINEADILDALRSVYDPELGLDIVSLGLIYKITIDGDSVWLLMTMTTPGCPMHDSIGTGVEWTLKQLPGVNNVQIELTWEPPWEPSLMSAAARFALGFD